MTKDDAINILLDHLSAGLIRTLEDAIAKEEREECAKICLNLYKQFYETHRDSFIIYECIKAIRARGQE